MAMTIANEMDKKIVEELLGETDTFIAELETEIEKLDYDFNKKLVLKGFLECRNYSHINLDVFKMDFNEDELYKMHNETRRIKETKLSDFKRLKNDLQSSLDIYNKNYN